MNETEGLSVQEVCPTNCQAAPPLDTNDRGQEETTDGMRQFAAFVELASTERQSDHYEAALGIRKLSEGQTLPVNELIGSGVLSIFVDSFLKRHDMSDLQFEAAWALGLTAKGGVQGRDHLIAIGAVDALVAISGNGQSDRQVRQKGIWALSNLCSGKPLPGFESVAGAIPVLAAALNDTDLPIVGAAARAFVHMTNESVGKAVPDSSLLGVLPRFVELLGHPSTDVLFPVTTFIGNLAAGTTVQTSLVIKSGALHQLRLLLGHPHSRVRREVCYTLSNVLAGTQKQIQAVIDADLVHPILNALFDSDDTVRREALWAIRLYAEGANNSQRRDFIGAGCLDDVCQLLDTPDAKRLCCVLETINLVKEFERERVLHCAGSKLKSLLEHPDIEVQSIAGEVYESISQPSC